MYLEFLLFHVVDTVNEGEQMHKILSHEKKL